MAGTYSQLYIQVVFAVAGRQQLIASSFRETLHKYITGIVQLNGQKLLAIFCMPDHVHLFIGLQPSMRISDLVRDIKTNSTNFINDSHYLNFKFSWQSGYGVFSYSKSHVDAVVKYILNQEVHHRKNKFKDEYIGLLEKFQIEYKKEYLFDWID
jgi:putative transposase